MSLAGVNCPTMASVTQRNIQQAYTASMRRNHFSLHIHIQTTDHLLCPAPCGGGIKRWWPWSVFPSVCLSRVKSKAACHTSWAPIIIIIIIIIITSCAGGRHNMPCPLQVDLWPFDLESGARVTHDVGFLCANFSLPRPLYSQLKPDVRDRQTSDAHNRLIICKVECLYVCYRVVPINSALLRSCVTEELCKIQLMRMNSELCTKAQPDHADSEWGGGRPQRSRVYR